MIKMETTHTVTLATLFFYTVIFISIGLGNV